MRNARIKASAGALTKINICREKSLVTTIKYLKAHGIKVFGAALNGAVDIAADASIRRSLSQKLTFP